MKFFKTKTIVITGTITLLAGLILLFVGFQMGGASNSIVFDSGKFQVVSNHPRRETKVLNARIKNINVKLDAVNVYFQVGDKFSVRSELSLRKLMIGQSGDTASLSTSNVASSFSVWNWPENPDYIVITVPDKNTLKTITLNTNAGDVYLGKLDLVRLSGKNNSGSLTLRNLSTQSLNLKANAASLNISNLTVTSASSLNLNACKLIVMQAQPLPDLKVTGNASSLRINGSHKSLPFSQGNQAKSLKVILNASSMNYKEIDE